MLLFILAISASQNSLELPNIELQKENETDFPKLIEIDHQTAIIEGNGNFINTPLLNAISSSYENIVIQQAPSTIIEGLTLIGVNITLIDSPNSIIRDNIITGITGTVVYGIYISNSPDTLVVNNNIQGLNGTIDAYGIYIKDSLNVVIENNEISSLSTPDGDAYGIFSFGTGSVTITGNNVHHLSGIYVHGIDTRLNGGFDIVHSNIITDLSGESLSGIISSGTNQQSFEMNTITRLITTSTGREVVGIALFGNDFTVSNNFINDLHTIGISKVFGYGILVNSETFTIVNNSISAISAFTVSDYVNVFGIYLESGSNPSNLVSNNVIEDISSDGITDAVTFGLYFYRSSNFMVEFNKILNLQAISPNGMLISEIFLLECNLANFNFIEGSTNSIIWSHDGITTHNQYYLYLDNVNIETNPWVDGARFGSTKVNINTDLPVASYENTILIVDTVNSIIPITDTITVNILPAFDPLLVDSVSPQTELGLIDNFVIWEFVDNNPSYYEIFTNDLLVINSTWISGVPILYRVDHLGPDNYNFSIYVYDQDANSSNNTILVTIQDTLFPEISPFNDQKFEQEIISSNITWFLTDFNPDYFKLYANGTEVLNGTWQNQIPIIFSLFDWDLGLTNFTMEAHDLYGHVTKLAIFVSVVDTLEPLLNEPFDIFFDEGDLNIKLEWIAEDFNPGNWTLYENGVNYQNGTWESGVPITFSLDEYKWGKYNFTIFVHDAFGNTVADTVLVNVMLTSDSPYTKNTETKSTQQNLLDDIDPVYIAAGGVLIGVATIGSVLRRRRGF
ncbi:MAG: hypothetical protein GPJ54_19490 [Candidatus Heimdallarchaeota archaeon]|nr:hypothetical protein [Candidatus Heimdallarchaeota archaeon]